MNHPDVEALRALDQIDVKARKLKSEIADLPAELNKHKAAHQAALDRLTHVQSEQKRLAHEIHKIEGETKAGNDQITKFQVQQNTAKTNDEYAALRKSIEGVKKQLGELEDKALGHYDQIDKLKAEETAAKKAIKEAEGKLKAEEADVQKEIDGLQQQLGAVMAERADLEKKVGMESLSRYKRVLEKLQGKRALAAVRGRTCQGCFIELSPNNVSVLLSKRELMVCPQCSRILFLEHDYRVHSPSSYSVSDKDRDSTSKDGNW